VQLLPDAIDNNNNHLFTKTETLSPLAYPLESAFYFQFDNPAMNFVNNQTMCMDINYNQSEPGATSEVWTLNNCSTLY